MGRVGRRKFLIATGAFFAAPLAAKAQQARKKEVRIGYLATTSQPLDDVFRQGLRDLGYLEGENIVTEYRWGEGAGRSYVDLAKELARLKVDVIVAVGSPPTDAAKQATDAIPIVMVAVGDPVAYGFVPSLARPGGNITGLSSAIPTILAKGLQFLKEVVPTATRVAFLVSPAYAGAGSIDALMQSAAQMLGITLENQYVQKLDEFESAFAAISRKRPHALLVSPDHFLYSQRAQILEFALRNRLPAMYFLRAYVPMGGLMALGPDRNEMYRRAAFYVDKILKGAKPADLPVEQPTKFELVINLKTARALGITIPQSVLFRATEVIE